jgi:acyl carrier protein
LICGHIALLFLRGSEPAEANLAITPDYAWCKIKLPEFSFAFKIQRAGASSNRGKSEFTMSEQEVLQEIKKIIGTIAVSKGLPAPKVEPETILLTELPIDSLDLAAVLGELQQITNYDPFKAGFINFRTAGELARLYQR